MSQETLLLVLVSAVFAQTTYLSYKHIKTTATPSKTTAVLVDTSVLMDGRIVQVAEAGFIPGKLVIPRSVVGELQLLADGGDNEKRERARRGLDVVKLLQSMEHIVVELLQDGKRTENGVDDQLLALAKKYHGMICTIDFNLNKVAQVENIRVLNINELAQQLRMTYMPGDQLRLELKHQGSDSHQAVGHLSDGTMVVVEQARAQIGKTVTIEVIRSLQTHAGRMMFARVVPSSAAPQKSETRPRQKNRHAAVQPTAHEAPTRQSTPGGAATSPKKPARQPRAARHHRSAKQSEAALIDLVDRQ